MKKIKWTNEPNNFTDILDFSKGKVKSASPLVWEHVDSFCLDVETPNGHVLARLGDTLLKIDEKIYVEGKNKIIPTKLWAEYYHGAMDAKLIAIWRGTEEQIVQKFIDDWGEDLDYETLMSCEYQYENDFKLEEINENIIQYL